MTSMTPNQLRCPSLWKLSQKRWDWKLSLGISCKVWAGTCRLFVSGFHWFVAIFLTHRSWEDILSTETCDHPSWWFRLFNLKKQEPWALGPWLKYVGTVFQLKRLGEYVKTIHRGTKPTSVNENWLLHIVLNCRNVQKIQVITWVEKKQSAKQIESTTSTHAVLLSKTPQRHPKQKWYVQEIFDLSHPSATFIRWFCLSPLKDMFVKCGSSYPNIQRYYN